MGDFGNKWSADDAFKPTPWKGEKEREGSRKREDEPDRSQNRTRRQSVECFYCKGAHYADQCRRFQTCESRCFMASFDVLKGGGKKGKQMRQLEGIQRKRALRLKNLKFKGDFSDTEEESSDSSDSDYHRQKKKKKKKKEKKSKKSKKKRVVSSSSSSASSSGASSSEEEKAQAVEKVEKKGKDLTKGQEKKSSAKKKPGKPGPVPGSKRRRVDKSAESA